ncbi:MAG: hypothetical protein KBC43_12835 [Bacteroidales bacterium]|nr:hypothetical protein [Bacteroidales bacterium]
MNWIEKLFGKRNVGKDMQEINLENENIFPEIPENVFVENSAPEPEVPFAEPKGADILAFLKQDFRAIGYRDGYTYHSNEKQAHVIKSMKADFRLEIDQLIDKKKEAKLLLEEQKIEAHGLSEELVRKIELRIEHTGQLIIKLEKEKELSALDEGWIMRAIHAYRDGYVSGTETCLEEKNLGLSNGSFN